MKTLFLKIPVELPKQPSTKVKNQSLLHAIGDGWYVNKLGQKLPPLNKKRLNKKSPKDDDEIKRKLYKSNQARNDWKFQIHWNKLEWVNPRSRNERKNQFCVSSKNCLKITLKLHIGLVTRN